MRIKILFLSHRTDIGGGELSLYDLISYLSEKNKIEPFIVLADNGPLFEKFSKAGFNVITIHMPPLKKFNLISALTIKNIMSKNSISIIHANTTRSAMYAAAAKIFGYICFSKIRIVWHNRGTDKRSFFEYAVSLFSDKLIAISNAVKKGLTGAGINENKIDVIYNGLFLKPYKLENNIVGHTPDVPCNFVNNSGKKTVVGLIGRFTSEKGHKYLVEAADIIINKLGKKNIIFKLAGSDNFGKSIVDNLKKLILDRNLEKYFEFCGYVENIIEFINKNIDIVAIPSEREAFGRVVVESWIAGKPIIAFNVEGLAELIENGKNGILIQPENSDILAEKIIELSENFELQKTLTGNGLKTAVDFDVKYSADRILNLWERL